MASKVNICNAALSRIGASEITDVDTPENTAEAKACNRVYDQVAEHVQASGPWTACITLASLAKTANTPSFNWSSEFQLPTSPRVLKVLGVDETFPGDVPYEIVGDKLLCDESSIKIRYIGFITDTGSYGPFLTQAIVSRLAAELSYTFSGKASLVDKLLAKAEEDLVNGISQDNQQGSRDLIRSSDLTDIR